MSPDRIEQIREGLPLQHECLGHGSPIILFHGASKFVTEKIKVCPICAARELLKFIEELTHYGVKKT